MLILKRKVGESLRIVGDCVITISKVEGGRVHIAIIGSDNTQVERIDEHGKEERAERFEVDGNRA